MAPRGESLEGLQRYSREQDLEATEEGRERVATGEGQGGRPDPRTRDARSMAVYVKTLTGKTIHLGDVSPLSTVAELKQRIEAEEEIPRDQMRLICAGKPMENEHASLESLGVAPRTTIHLVLRCVPP